MFEKEILIVLITILAVKAIHFVLFFYDFYTAGAIQDAFTPEKIQETLQGAMSSNELSEVRADAGAQGGVNRSAAIRMKEFDKILGEGLIDNVDPTIKAAVSAVFPQAEGWIERNPDLAAKALKKLEPFLQNILQGQGGGNSGQGKSGGWG